MKILRGWPMAGLSLALLGVSAPYARAVTLSAANPDGTPYLVTELKFSSTAPLASTSSAVSAAVSSAVSPGVSAAGWTFWVKNGGLLGVQSTTSPQGGGEIDALEGSYPVPAGQGSNYIGAAYDISALNTEDVYVEFWAKMPGVKEGCKFLKVFGDRIPNQGYADTTVITDYTGADYGALRHISFGDGSTLVNDSQDIVDLRGPSYSHLGRSADTAVLQTPQNSWFTPADWGTGWHHFRVHIKFNSGTSSSNEVPDGEYYLEIDGKVYANVTGLYNRNPANGPINRIDFFGWAQTESQPFQVWYDDIRISTGGFMSQPLPDPPSNVGAK